MKATSNISMLWLLTGSAGITTRCCAWCALTRAFCSRHNDTTWLNIWNATSAYYHALRGETDAIPKIFSEHKLTSVNILAPGKPMTEMIENQVYLAQGSYAKVIGRSAELLAACEGMHYALAALHIRIQTAAAYEMLGKAAEAHAALSAALSDAAPDGFVMPFAENYSYLESALAREIRDDFIAQNAAQARTAAILTAF